MNLARMYVMYTTHVCINTNALRHIGAICLYIYVRESMIIIEKLDYVNRTGTTLIALSFYLIDPTIS